MPSEMHVYNAWLPLHVAEQCPRETEAFGRAVRALQESLRSPNPKARSSSSVKWTSVFLNFLRAKSILNLGDVEILVPMLLDLILDSKENLYVQARWCNVVGAFLKKYKKKIDIDVRWRPLYEVFVQAHFNRSQAFKGVALKQFHQEHLSILIRRVRHFFTVDSAAEIWSEFRPLLKDISHNDALMGVGFISLFLPTNSRNSSFFKSEWLAECIGLWGQLPDCNFWDSQWASLVGRTIRHHELFPSLDLKAVLPHLFSRYLNVFEIPVGGASSTYQRAIPRDIHLVFSSTSLVKHVAKGIVFLITPDNEAQKNLDVIINLLEQYYHPSNAGFWTSTLERFLNYLVFYFMKRIAREQRLQVVEGAGELKSSLGKIEREAFAKALLVLVKRAQYSRNTRLSDTAALASSKLSFIEPFVMLPQVVSCFYLALETTTATHQLEYVIATVAQCARPLILASLKEVEDTTQEPFGSDGNSMKNISEMLTLAFSNTVHGMDPNDPAKTLATIQLLCSFLSSLGELGREDADANVVLSIDWPRWVDEFISRLFSLLVHVESSEQLIEDSNDASSLVSKTFLVKKGSFYISMLDLLFQRLTGTLYDQALKRVVKFIQNNVLPGAVAEIGLLCSAIVNANPEKGFEKLIQPLISSILSSFNEVPSASGESGGSSMIIGSKSALLPALENLITYQLNVLSVGVAFIGSAILQCKEMLKKVITCAFQAPSVKVNKAGGQVLSSILGALILYYPFDQYKLSQSSQSLGGAEDWINTKDHSTADKTAPKWHYPNLDEITLATELLECHLMKQISQLKVICQENGVKDSGQQKEMMQGILMQIEASLRGVRSCLPDFPCLDPSSPSDDGVSFIAGAAGVAIGDAKMRDAAALAMHDILEYLWNNWNDDSSLLSLVVRIIDLLVNYGYIEYEEWLRGKNAWITESKSIAEPFTNFLTNKHALTHQRPKWMVLEKVFLHNTWRASQSRYNQYRIDSERSYTPNSVVMLSHDLLKLSFHTYETIRSLAGTSLRNVFKRFPSQVKDCFPLLLNPFQDLGAKEHCVLGACAILKSRHVLRFIPQDWKVLSSFLVAILNSSHHESVKAQSAINELFLMFSIRFGAVPVDLDESLSCTALIKQIQSLCGNGMNVHWRYNLMSQAVLLLLVVSILSKTSGSNISDISDLHKSIAEHFLSALKSDLPPLRPLSIVAMLVLLQASPHKMERNKDGAKRLQKEKEVWSLEGSLVPMLKEEKFASTILSNISIDHFYPDKLSGRTRGSGRISMQRGDIGLTSWIPSIGHEWPRTRSWDANMKGEAFSENYARFSKRLLQECGPAVLEAFRAPLEDAINGSDERGNQCASAELVAGFLHSDVNCIVEAWNEWLRPLLRKSLLQASVESAAEWAACVRFAVTGKGVGGERPPIMRSYVLECLAEALPDSASSSIEAKRFNLLCAALVEVLPSSSDSKDFAFQKTLMEEVMHCISHPAPQVREAVGNLLCVLGGNLQSVNLNIRDDLGSAQIEDWKVSLVKESVKSVLNIQNSMSAILGQNGMLPSENDEELQEAIRKTETVLYFIIATVRSGRFMLLTEVIVELLHSVLALQDTPHKDLSSLAKIAGRCLEWHPLPAQTTPKAMDNLLVATRDANWRTRVATLQFIQVFIYRHIFLLSKGRLVILWEGVETLLSDNQVEVREAASATLAGMMKCVDKDLAASFRSRILGHASSILESRRGKRVRAPGQVDFSPSAQHGVILGIAACVMSFPYDVPSWLPNLIAVLARFRNEPAPIRTTVVKVIAEFRRTHAVTWILQKNVFTDEELEILESTSSSGSYFA